MRKTTLTTAAILCAASIFQAAAESAVYTYSYTDDEGYTLPVIGAIRRVSPNGLWGTGGDDYQDTGSFIINTADPENVSIQPGGLLLDIDNNGMAVGAWYENIGGASYKRAALLKDGQWTLLPTPPSIIGQSYAVAISADSKVIGGHAMCASSDAEETGIVGGKYFPIFWELDEATGRYELGAVYNDVELPGTLGFFSYDMTPDGNILCGLQCLDMGDVIAAMFDRRTGLYTTWNDITFRRVLFDYMGETYYRDNVMFVDGVMDGGDSGEFRGMFTYATDRYLFGCRDVVSDVDEEGNGIITTYATLYDLATGEFTDGRKNCAYVCGVDAERNFTTSGLIDLVTPEDGAFNLDVNEYLAFFCDIDNADLLGTYSIDDSSRVWGASTLVITPFGEELEGPALVLLDQPVFTGVADVAAESARPTISREGRTFCINGAKDTAVYTAGGVLVTKSHTFTLTPGVYVVVADGTSRKIAVR